MHVLAVTAVLLLGTALAGAVGASVLRASTALGGRSTRIELALVRAAIWTQCAVGRRTPLGALARRAFRVCGPVILAALLLCWLAGLGLGGALVADAAAGLGAGPGLLARALLTGGGLHGPARAAVSLTWLAAGAVVVLWAGLVAQIAGAYHARELLATQVGTLASSDVDAEEIIAQHGRAASTQQLAALLDGWGEALGRLGRSHVAHPVLIVLPTARRSLCWVRMLMIMLDVAALLDVAVKDVAPPRTRAFLRSGCATAQALAGVLGLPVAPVDASLHGREGRTFATTISIMRNSGLPMRADAAAVYREFQHWRLGYGPHMTTLAVRLMYDKPVGLGRPDPLESAPDAVSAGIRV